MKQACFACLAAFAGTTSGLAQSLFLIPPPAAPIGEAPVDPAAEVYAYSLVSVQPPRPKTVKVHDLVTIIVDQSSKQEAEQSLQAKKTYDVSADIGPLIDFMEVLEARLVGGNSSGIPLVNAGYDNKFKGDGSFERTDRFTAKIQAEIIDVKPNGTLVLEARQHIAKGREVQTIVLSGKCRLEDVTDSNTLFSYQLADLMLVTTQEGQVDKAGKKGLIPRVLETLFAF